jgi:hypothetical protein
MGKVLRGDFGTTIRGNQPVLELLLVRLPNTLMLALSSLLITMVVGVTAGLLCRLQTRHLAGYHLDDGGDYRHFNSQLLAGADADVCVLDSPGLAAGIGHGL